MLNQSTVIAEPLKIKNIPPKDVLALFENADLTSVNINGCTVKSNTSSEDAVI